MKVLIIGASGYLGSRIQKLMSDDHFVIGSYFSRPHEDFCRLDITNFRETSNLISDLRPDLIVHSAGLIDECLSNTAEAVKVNIEGIMNVSKSALVIGTSIVYISSAAVFDGYLKEKKFGEGDVPITDTPYGQMKLKCERILNKINIPHLIIRPSLFVGASQERVDKFFPRTVKQMQFEESINLDSYWKFTPTWLDSIYHTIIWWLNNQAKTKLLHVACSDVVSKLELMETYRDISKKKNVILNPLSSKGKRHFSILDVTKLTNFLGKTYTIKDTFEKMLVD